MAPITSKLTEVIDSIDQEVAKITGDADVAVKKAATKKPAVKKPAPEKPTTKTETSTSTGVMSKTMDMIVTAIKDLKERNGSSLKAIMKVTLAANPDVNSDKIYPHIKKSLKTGVEKGILTQVKGSGVNGSFKVKALPKPEKKVVKPKKTEKKTEKKPVKKTDTKKAVAKPKTKPAAKKTDDKKKPAAKKPTTAKKPAEKKPAAKKPAVKTIKKPAAKEQKKATKPKAALAKKTPVKKATKPAPAKKTKTPKKK